MQDFLFSFITVITINLCKGQLQKTFDYPANFFFNIQYDNNCIMFDTKNGEIACVRVMYVCPASDIFVSLW